ALTTESQTLTIRDAPTPPIPSLLRGFSAPVKLEVDLSDGDLVTLLRSDSDSFNRWQSAQQLAIRTLKRAVAAQAAGEATPPDDYLADALVSV
ncbi:DUF3458 domain-containing protein, partial [Acinetobacter baumannii]